MLPRSGFAPSGGKSDDLRKFTALTARLVQIIRTLFIPSSKITEFTTQIQAISEKGADTLQKTSDTKEFFDSLKEFEDSLKGYVTKGLSDKERAVFFADEFDSIDKALTSLDGKSPKNEGALKQWKASQQEVTARVQEMREEILHYKEDLGLLDALMVFSQNLTTSKLLRLSDLNMNSRSEIVVTIKRSVDRLSNFVKNWRNEGKINKNAVNEVHTVLTKVYDLFKDPDEESKPVKVAPKPDLEPTKKPAAVETIETRIKKAKKNNTLLQERVEAAKEATADLETKVDALSTRLEKDRQELESLRLSKAEFNVFGQCTSMKKTKDIITGEIAGLKSELPELKEKVEQYQASHDEYVQISQNEASLKKMNDHLKLVKKRLVNRENDLDKAICDLTSYAVDRKNALSRSPADVKAIEKEVQELEEKLQALLSEQHEEESHNESPDTERFEKVLQTLQTRNTSLADNAGEESSLDAEIANVKQELDDVLAKISEYEKRDRPVSIEEVKRSLFDPYGRTDEERLAYHSESRALKKTIDKTKTRAVQFNGKDMTLAESKAMLEKLEHQYSQAEIHLESRPPVYGKLEAIREQISAKQEALYASITEDMNRRKELIGLERQLAECHREQDMLKRICVDVQVPETLNLDEQETLKTALTAKMEVSACIRNLDEAFSELFRDRLAVRASLSVPEKIASIIYMIPKVAEQK